MSGAFLSAVRRLLESQVPSRKGGLKVDQPYGQALEAFWQKKYKLALGIVSERLAEDPDCADFAHYYRLWIEVCAESGDQQSLRSLKKHLFVMGRERVSQHMTFFALRGLVHLELDEYEAASTLSRACDVHEVNPYVLELKQRLVLRQREASGFQGDDELSHISLLRVKGVMKEYFHWHYLVFGLLTIGHQEALNLVLEQMGERYPHSPLPHLFEYHRSLERGYFAAAGTVAERLRELAPGVIDYMYFQAYAYFEDGDYPSARKVLHEANRITSGLDAEVVGLLGHCHAKLGGAQEAAECLRKSMQLLSDEGLPATHVAMEYLDVQQEIAGQPRSAETAEIPREPQGWIIELSPRRVHEFLSSPDNVTERLLRPMGTRALPGDLCFLTVATKSAVKWSMFAVYAVESEPMWHPLHGHQSILKRVTTFPQTIAIDVARMPAELEESFLDQEKDLALRDAWGEISHLARRFGIKTKKMSHSFERTGTFLGAGLYQLDADALMVVEDVIAKHHEDMVERRKSLQSRRPTA